MLIGKIINKLRELSYEDTGLGHCIRASYKILKHPITNAIFMIIAPIIISIPISRQYYGWGFWLLLVLLLLGVVLLTIVQRYNQKKDNNIRWFIKSIDGFSQVAHTLAGNTRKFTKFIFTKGKDGISLNDIENNNGLKNTALETCKAIYGMIKSMDDKHDNLSPYVTVYAKLPRKRDGEGGFVCKMIAYENIGHEEPTSYACQYEINDDSCYHSQIFNSQDSSIRILNGKEEISQFFSFHKGASNREREIEQYIGIPINANEVGISMLLQIDINIPNFFGDSKATIEEFARHIFMPYCHVLSVAYENERLYKCAYKKWNEK